ncbi:MAG: hypothetical protein IJP44_07515 [Bacteroidales bacterium]|nr:hypothetical protein [Bacteroidales bacterium]
MGKRGIPPCHGDDRHRNTFGFVWIIADATIRQIYDLALLSKNLLKGKDLNEFVKRILEKL